MEDELLNLHFIGILYAFGTGHIGESTARQFFGNSQLNASHGNQPSVLLNFNEVVNSLLKFSQRNPPDKS